MSPSGRSVFRQPLSQAHFEQGVPPASDLDVQLEAVASTFEVQRAMDAYIPLLVACYALANRQPFELPAGYSALAEVRTDATEMAGLEAAVSSEAREAVSNDLEALGNAIADPSAFGFVVREDATGSLLVCIRGTQTPGEWRANFTAVPKTFGLASDFGLVHLGFEMMHRSVRGSIEAALQGVAADVRVTVIGHSLGGAMATLAAVDLKRNLGRQAVDLCTFGGPRVGKPTFRNKFNREIRTCHRVTNAGDVVPHVPSMLTGWSHVGEEIEVDSATENPHSLVSHLEGLRNIGTVRELVFGGGQEVPMPAVMSVRVP